MSSLEVTDKASAAVATAPRVALTDIEDAIRVRYDTTADKAVDHIGSVAQCDELKLLSVCILVMKNGFVIVGKSAPASPANFNAELGKKFAYEDAVRQLWPLMGFALRDRLSQRSAFAVDELAPQPEQAPPLVEHCEPAPAAVPPAAVPPAAAE